MTLEVMSPTAALLDGRYILHDRVGQGGMATVYRAEDTHLGRTVAIKMIHEGEGPVASIERAHTEKTLLASLSHPSLVTLYDAQLTPNRPQYLVMEFVEGPTLADRMAEGPMPPADVARITRDLATGLTAVHAAGIVHRDVKPSNVLLASDRTGRPVVAKLADFGIACAIDDTRLTTPGIVLGTLTYMAPEQLRDQEPGTPVDVFSLGLVALEALTGEAGYPSLASGRAAAIARLAHPPIIPATVPDGWRDLITRMTQLDPQERPDAAEVARVTRALVRGSGGDTSETAVAAGSASIVAAAGPVPARGAVGGVGAVGGAGAVGAVGELGAADAVGAADDRVPADTAHEPDAVGSARETGAIGATRTGATAVFPATDSTDAPVRARTRRGTRTGTRTRVIAGAAGVAAAGALVVGFAAFTAPTSDIGRVASTAVIRTASTPAEAEPQSTPVETVTDAETPAESGNPGNSGTPADSGNPGNEGNPGNSGKNDKTDKTDKSGKPDKADKSNGDSGKN